MKHFVIICFLLTAVLSLTLSVSMRAAEPANNLPNRGILGKQRPGVYDPSVDYDKLSARVSDYDISKSVFKFQFENRNIKFLKSGDELKFSILNHKGKCRAQVQRVEQEYVIAQVATLSLCWKSTEYFRRGTIVKMDIPIMLQRVYEAAQYRKTLIRKRSDFLSQMKKLNNFLYNYDQERVKLIVDFDEQIARLMEEKKKATRALLARRKESYGLRQQLAKKLDESDRDLNFYRLEKQELFVDRWNQSPDLGLPFARRPQDKKSQK